MPSEADATKPKYAEPLEEITDLAGVRVIAFFPGTLSSIDSVINEEFEITEKSD
jgi:ppGpp synthetase/RelA/SpoT-type nucleotidyltranferase